MQFAFVLVRPQFAGNIGSVARAMMNFGFSDLRLVEPNTDHLNAEARKMAVKALPLLADCKIYGSLGEALADIELAIGTSSGRQREIVPAPLPELIAALGKNKAPQKVAFVFGDERDGLTYDEMMRCHRLCAIKTSREFPALNLAQAAGICAYEASKINGNGNAQISAGEKDEFATGKDGDEIFNLAEIWLEQVGFLRRYNHRQILQELRKVYHRLSPTKRESDLLAGVIMCTLKALGKELSKS